VIRFDAVTFRYADAPDPVLRAVTASVGEGELALVIGPTGAGKSTLLGLVNGLVPHFSGGTLDGHVTVAGRDTRDQPPRDLADVVGVVGQDPLAGFVTDTVEEELAYGMEQLAVPADVMRKRVEETLDLLGLAHLRRRALRDLSGGEQQRVAIGSVLTAHPRVLVLDEPTSALDPTAAEEVLAAITRLVHDLGITVVMAEHRLERVAQYADRVLLLDGSGAVRSGAAADVLADSPIVPPVTELGRLVGWVPPPLSVRDARRHAADLRTDLAGARPPARRPLGSGPVGLAARGVVVRHGPVVAVREVDLDLVRGEVVGLMGRNGSGKSSLLWALQGSGRRASGTVDVGGDDPRALAPPEARRLVGLVPQSPADLLYLSTVRDECAQADAESGAPAGSCRDLLDRLTAGRHGTSAIPDDRHPRDLSEGQRLALVLAIQLTARPGIVLLDEPTRGLDYAAKRRFVVAVRDLASDGAAVVVASHDVELVAELADRVVVLADGEIVADGTAAHVLGASPAFAPQVAKVLGPAGAGAGAAWLTVGEVAAALARLPDAGSLTADRGGRQ
jgi:energy-coupling factor transport system ATP-binding protein